MRAWKTKRVGEWESWNLGKFLGLHSRINQRLPRNQLFPHLFQFVFLLGCCLVLVVGCQSQQLPTGRAVPVQVQRVVSGQTLDVLNPSQSAASIERVRLIGIEAPDLRQEPWGSAAKNRLEQLISQVPDQQLTLQPVILEADVQEKDSAGRWLAYVWYDGRLINEVLVKEGYVLAAPRSPNQKYDERLARAQEYARLMGYGLWNPDRPMRLLPAEFRRLNP